MNHLKLGIPASTGTDSSFPAGVQQATASARCLPARLKAGFHAVAGVAGVALLLIAAGCTSASKAREQARLAYLAGQRDAIAQMAQQPTQAANVTFIGPVDNPVVPWTQGLTLTGGILAAGYHAEIDPVMIFIRRTREEVQVDPARVLSGFDIPLQPGDIVQFQLPVPPSEWPTLPSQ